MKSFGIPRFRIAPGQTARSLMDDGLGDSEYSFEKYVSGAYGDKITEYFKTYALYTGQDDHPDVWSTA